MLRRNLTDAGTSDEVQALKNRVNSQDTELAAQKTQLMKQTDLLNDCQTSLNDALYKLNQETQRSMELEKELKQRMGEHQSQSVASQNVEMSLAGARNVVKEKEKEVKELQLSLETTSRVSEEHKLHATKLGREKSMLEARIRELETEVQKKTTPNPVTHRRTAPQSPPSSVSEEKLKTLERELDDAQSALSQTKENLSSVSQKLSQTQSELVRVENERAAEKKRMESQLAELNASLEEKEAELQFMKSQAGEGNREDELIKRIEEDEVKITTLESMLRDTQDNHRLKEQMKNVETKLADEVKKRTETEEQCIGLVREKEEAQDELAGVKAELQRLMKIVNGDSHLNSGIESRERHIGHPGGMNSDFAPTPLSQAKPDETTISYIERLLVAIDRLRSERDSLRRDVHFLESESRFAVESLEAKLSALTAATTNTCSSGLVAAKTKRFADRSALVAMANAVVIGHLDFRNVQMEDRLYSKARVVEQQAGRIRDLESQLNESRSELQAICSRRDDIQSQLAQKEMQWQEELQQQLSRFSQSSRNNVDELERQVTDLSRALENVESERDSLSLQVTNLTSEIQSLQLELTNAESRYSSLQSQQLSTMSANEANRVLCDQLKEMEMRVARRTEQIGIHQHDIRRLETNLRLQEERLGEMTTELETLAAQKDAMVEDCADAREARDAALLRVEALEMELEVSETKSERSDEALVSLIGVYVQTSRQAKDLMKKMQDKNAILAHQFNVAHVFQQTLSQTSEDDKRSILTLRQSLEDSETTLRQMGVALAMSRAEAKDAAHALKVSQEEGSRLCAQMEELTSCVEQREDHSISATLELLNKNSQELEMSSREVERLSQELVHLTESHGRERAEHDQQIRSLDTQRLSTEGALKELQGRINSTIAQLGQSHEELEMIREEKRSLQEATTNLEAELQRSTTMAKYLESQVKESEQAIATLTSECDASRAERLSAESDLKELQGRMDSTIVKLGQSHEELEVVRKEKQSLQETTTNLEAELQRSASMTRYLESQVKECEQAIATLTSECDTLRAELLCMEKSSKAAEVNLSLQGAQHKREISGLQKEVDALRSKPDLAAALTALEESNNEMEELLRKKCAEIEENDDRVLEILKENKKLTAKVESLNRKVQNLQAKLSAAKASIPKTEATSSVPFPSTAPPAASTATGSAVVPPKTVPSLAASYIGKPKTPERRTAHPTVFKAKSPDKRPSVAASEPESSGQVIGKKRRAPDDFELGEELGPQGFTIDSVPDDRNENRTPRVRRILSGGLTGFTPVRRSHPTEPSPKRASIAPVKPSSVISDVTNSPRGSSGKNGKRSWLGKIRGTAPHNPGRTTSSRVVSEKPGQFS